VTPEVYSASLCELNADGDMFNVMEANTDSAGALSWNRKRRDSKGLPGSENVACTERSVVELGRPLRVPYFRTVMGLFVQQQRRQTDNRWGVGHINSTPRLGEPATRFCTSYNCARHGKGMCSDT